MIPYFKLSERGQKIFDLIKKHLDGQKEDVDVYGLTVLAQAFDDFAEGVELIKKEGMYYTNRNNQRVLHPAVSVKDKAVTWIFKLAPKFGISPADREKIQSFATKERDKRFRDSKILSLLR